MDIELSPIHPGEILLEDFLMPMKISQNQLARAMRVAPGRINEIVNGKRAITAGTALRLSRALGVSAEFWMKLQMTYDLEVAREATSTVVIREVLPLYEASDKPAEDAA